MHGGQFNWLVHNDTMAQLLPIETHRGLSLVNVSHLCGSSSCVQYIYFRPQFEIFLFVSVCLCSQSQAPFFTYPEFDRYIWVHVPLQTVTFNLIRNTRLVYKELGDSVCDSVFYSLLMLELFMGHTLVKETVVSS